MKTYAEEYANWQADPDSFWMQQAAELNWHTVPSEAHSRDSNGLSQWFADGQLNTCYLALDHHVEQGRGEQTALIYDSPVTNSTAEYSYADLQHEVATLAATIAEMGVTKGDTVVIYMPMIPQAVMAMLACARLGAIHSVVFGGFAAPELAARIDDAEPKLVMTATCGIEVSKLIAYQPLLNAALDLAQHKVEHCLVFERPELAAQLVEGRDRDWQSEVDKSKAKGLSADAVPVSGHHPLYILYTSGTTGMPKGVVRTHGGHAVALKYSFKTVYGMDPGDVFWSASDIGWVVGHSYIVYAPLLQGCTSIFYEGKPIMTPDASAFWRVIQQHKVNALFAAPTAFRAIRGVDPDCELIKQYDISSLRTVYAAGERLDPDTQDWMESKIKVPVIDNWWQTETGWPIVANPVGLELLPIKAGSASVPIAGYDVQILNEEGHQVPAGTQGKVAIRLPLPPGCLSTLWRDDERFKREYLSDYPGYYVTGDGGYIDDDGYVFVMGRVDDVINIAGHRLSTGDIEEVIAKHPKVSECAVVAQADDLKGELPVGFVVAKLGESESVDELYRELVQKVRNDIGPLACYKTTFIVEKLPKTRSGKILRKTMKQLLNGDEVVVPPTIEDTSALDALKQIVTAQQT